MLSGNDAETPKLRRFAEAYVEMWKQARYRPQAPSDGMGNIQLEEEELRDTGRMQREAAAYARRFNAEENKLTFQIGCSDFRTNRAFVWAIEAARQLASGSDGNPFALKLLEMAAREVRQEIERAKRE